MIIESSTAHVGAGRRAHAFLFAASTAMLSVALAQPAFAQDTTAPQAQGADQTDKSAAQQAQQPQIAAGPTEPAGGQDIVVTGSRIARRDYEANSPIVTANQQLLQQSNTAAIEQNLNKLPEFTPAKTPTAGGDIQPTATNTPGSATVSLRGLGANRNLVLIDGRRATPSNASMAVDINTIPAAAIERVEIISGGASATYGADAVAGVANFILKKNFTGAELDGNIGLTQRGDQREYTLSGIIGTDFADGRGNVSVAMSMNDRAGSFQRDRPWYQKLWANPNTAGTGFFPDRPGVAFNANAPSNAAFYGATGVFTTATPFSNANGLPAANTINSGFAGPSPAFTSVYVNPDGTVFTGTGFAQRGGAYKFEGIDNFNYTLTSAGNIKKNDTYVYNILPLTRYNLLARANYEISDWLSIFGQGLFSNVSTRTLNEPAPIVSGWDVQIPYGTAIYAGDATRGIPSSVNTNGTTNAAYLPGGKYGLTNCPTTGGCPTYQVFPVPAELQKLLLSRGNVNGSVDLNWLLPQPRQTFTEVTTYNLIAGFDGKIPGTDWTFEIFGNRGESETYARQTGVASLARTRYLLTSPNFGKGLDVSSNSASERPNFGANFATCTSGFNLFTLSPDQVSADCYNAIRADLKSRSVMKQTIAEGDLQGTLFKLPAGDLKIAVGASYRKNDYSFINDTLTSQGSSFLDQAIGIYPSADTRATISAKEAYGELSVPIIKDLPFVKMLSLELGGRLSHYNTTGTSYTYKALGDWEVTSWLRFRGGYNRAERAPNIGELYLSSQQIFGVNNVGDLCSQQATYRISAGAASPIANDVKAVCSAVMDRTGGAGTAAAYYGRPVIQQPQPTPGFAFPTVTGNPNLKPEKADTYTAGVVLSSPFQEEALRRLRLTVDYFRIKVRDTIGQQTVGAALQACLDPNFNAAVAGAAGSAAQAAAAAASPYCSGVRYDPAPLLGLGNITLTYFNNGKVDISGLDAQVDWSVGVGPGTFNLNSVFNYYLHYKSTELADNPLIDYKGTFGTSENGLDAGVYRYRLFSTFGYALGAATIGVQWQHLPSIHSSAYALNPATTVTGAPSYDLFSLFGTLAVTRDVTFRLGVENLFDKAPPLTGVNTANTSPATNGNLPGGSYNTQFYDVEGRRFYMGVKAKF